MFPTLGKLWKLVAILFPIFEITVYFPQQVNVYVIALHIWSCISAPGKRGPDVYIPLKVHMHWVVDKIKRVRVILIIYYFGKIIMLVY